MPFCGAPCRWGKRPGGPTWRRVFRFRPRSKKAISGRRRGGGDHAVGSGLNGLWPRGGVTARVSIFQQVHVVRRAVESSRSGLRNGTVG